MNIGVVFPQTEFSSDPAAIRDYAQTVEGIGFSHIVAYDHILGVNPDRAGGWNGPYTFQHSFQEPFVLFAFMAGVTQIIGFTTSIIILPQRQTALVAKQAATLDRLSGGRLRLGVGLGWNEVEYVSLGQDFHTRGKRIEEQIHLLRRLWTEPLVNYAGRWDTIPDAGINPLPVQQPIPIWFGGNSEPALRRAARLGDGWMSWSRALQLWHRGAHPLWEWGPRNLARTGASLASRRRNAHFIQYHGRQPPNPCSAFECTPENCNLDRHQHREFGIRRFCYCAGFLRRITLRRLCHH